MINIDQTLISRDGHRLGDLVTLYFNGISVPAQVVKIHSDGEVDLAFARPDGTFPLDQPIDDPSQTPAPGAS